MRQVQARSARSVHRPLAPGKPSPQGLFPPGHGTSRTDANAVSFASGHHCLCQEIRMGKGMDRKKEGKKKPAKTLTEKRAAKKEKKQNRGSMP